MSQDDGEKPGYAKSIGDSDIRSSWDENDREHYDDGFVDGWDLDADGWDVGSVSTDSPAETDQKRSAPRNSSEKVSRKEKLPSSPWDLSSSVSADQPERKHVQVPVVSDSPWDLATKKAHIPSSPWDLEQSQTPYAGLRKLKQPDEAFVEAAKPVKNWPSEIRPVQDHFRGGEREPAATPSPIWRPRAARQASVAAMLTKPPLSANPHTDSALRKPNHRWVRNDESNSIGPLGAKNTNEDDLDATIGGGSPMMVDDELFGDMEEYKDPLHQGKEKTDSQDQMFGFDDALGHFEQIIAEGSILDIGQFVDPFEVGDDTLFLVANANADELIEQGALMEDEDDVVDAFAHAESYLEEASFPQNLGAEEDELDATFSGAFEELPALVALFDEDG